MRAQTLALALTAAAIAAAPAMAQTKDEGLIPGDFAVTALLGTDYVFRGISQTDGGPTAQVTVDYSLMFSDNLGIYLGVFGSNVDFDDGDEANFEFDVYGGLKGSIMGFSAQAGLIGYLYPGASVGGTAYDYYEFAAKVGRDFGIAAASVGVNYSPDYYFETGTGLYLSADVTVPLPFLPFEIGVLGHVGHQWIEDNTRFGTPDYTDWSLGVTGKVEGFVLTVSYVDTSIDDSRCFAGTGLASTCDARGLFTVSRTF